MIISCLFFYGKMFLFNILQNAFPNVNFFILILENYVMYCLFNIILISVTAKTIFVVHYLIHCRSLLYVFVTYWYVIFFLNFNYSFFYVRCNCKYRRQHRVLQLRQPIFILYIHYTYYTSIYYHHFSYYIYAYVKYAHVFHVKSFIVPFVHYKLPTPTGHVISNFHTNKLVMYTFFLSTLKLEHNVHFIHAEQLRLTMFICVPRLYFSFITLGIWY